MGNGREKAIVFLGGPLTQFEEPALAVGVKESVCQVVPIILWDLEGLVTDAVVEVLRGGEQGEELQADHAPSRGERKGGCVLSCACACLWHGNRDHVVTDSGGSKNN